ncbi:myelin-associated glycoprotein isoform X2 [Trichomycterus rosablanca]|uniref:myelin-associated glycoprotein isoform X2 n=1 Tax=Trichomycterus rosablanca TaxID=2290929 RepID=UPI002F358AC1
MELSHIEIRWIWAFLILTALIQERVTAGDWVVHVPTNPIFAPRGSTVTLPCTYDFPDESGNRHVLSEMWCLNHSLCITPDYIYHSASIFPELGYQGRVQYLGTLGSKNCSLRIDNLRMTDSGVYVFRFITDHPVRKLPGQKGVMLQVTESNFHYIAAIVGGIIFLLIVLCIIAVCVKRYCISKSHQAVLNDETHL